MQAPASEHYYLTLRLALDSVDRYSPRQFRITCEAYEWTFNRLHKHVERKWINEISSLIYLHVNRRLNLRTELERVRAELAAQSGERVAPARVVLVVGGAGALLAQALANQIGRSHGPL